LMSPVEQARAIRRLLARPSQEGDWPAEAWAAYHSIGVLRWTIPREFDGSAFSSAEVIAGCVELARIDLAPAFVLSQFQSACTRLVSTDNKEMRSRWLPVLARGNSLTTVGLSHLTTSRQHTIEPSVAAEPIDGGYRISGEIPWVTSGNRAAVIVCGAVLPDRRQIVFALPRDRAGLTVEPWWKLLALTGSETGPLRLDRVEIRREEIVAGPAEQVMYQGASGGTGSLTTSGLALGHALNCVDQLEFEALQRPALGEIVAAFRSDAERLTAALLGAAGDDDLPHETPGELRARSTALALSASQALLTASKGAGFVAGHPAERLAREAMFFLVWSCPQTVSSRLLKEFSGCEGA
jgi:alkylation response protein AidB-like acyl-CoA dehydrogenase